MKCAGGSTCVPHWPTCVKSSEKKPEPVVSGRLSYQEIVLRVSSGKPGQRGIPGANSCVRSTYFFDASTFWIRQSCKASVSDAGLLGAASAAADALQSKPRKTGISTPCKILCMRTLLKNLRAILLITLNN